MDPFVLITLGILNIMGQLNNYGIDVEKNPHLKDIRVRRQVYSEPYAFEDKEHGKILRTTNEELPEEPSISSILKGDANKREKRRDYKQITDSRYATNQAYNINQGINNRDIQPKNFFNSGNNIDNGNDNEYIDNAKTLPKNSIAPSNPDLIDKEYLRSNVKTQINSDRKTGTNGEDVTKYGYNNLRGETYMNNNMNIVRNEGNRFSMTTFSDVPTNKPRVGKAQRNIQNSNINRDLRNNERIIDFPSNNLGPYVASISTTPRNSYRPIRNIVHSYISNSARNNGNKLNHATSTPYTTNISDNSQNLRVDKTEQNNFIFNNARVVNNNRYNNYAQNGYDDVTAKNRHSVIFDASVRSVEVGELHVVNRKKRSYQTNVYKTNQQRAANAQIATNIQYSTEYSNSYKRYSNFNPVSSTESIRYTTSSYNRDTGNNNYLYSRNNGYSGINGGYNTNANNYIRNGYNSSNNGYFPNQYNSSYNGYNVNNNAYNFNNGYTFNWHNITTNNGYNTNWNNNYNPINNGYNTTWNYNTPNNGYNTNWYTNNNTINNRYNTSWSYNTTNNDIPYTYDPFGNVKPNNTLNRYQYSGYDFNNNTNGFPNYNINGMAYNNTNGFANNSVDLTNNDNIKNNVTTTTPKILQSVAIAGISCPKFMKYISIMGKKICMPEESDETLDEDDDW